MIIFILIGSILPLDSPLNMAIDYLQVRGLIRAGMLKPFEINAIISEIDTLIFLEEKLNNIDRRIVSLFGPFLRKGTEFYTNLSINAGRKNKELLFLNLDFQSSGQIKNNSVFSQGIRFHFSSDLDYTGPKPWKDIVQAYLNEGFIKLSDLKITFVMGRRNLLLGPGDEHSLLLSPAKEGYDGFLFLYQGKYYNFQSTFSVLDARKMRFISTHRIGMDLNRLQIGFSESILWTEEIEPLYLNFLLPYYLSQWGMDRNDNIMWCFDGLLNFFNTTIYGEFLIDDYQFSEPPAGYTEYPHKLAFQFGLKKILFEKLFFKFNYTFVDKWVYTHELRKNTYENDSLCLGFTLGNDVDRLTLMIRFLNDKNLFPKLNLEFIRKGEGSLYRPYEVERGPAYPEFPSGVVEKSIFILPGLEFYIQPRFHLNFEAGKKFISNFNHTPSTTKDENQMNIYFWWTF
ncbi:MAG: hypothetical protein N3A65_05460 [candidate division WOR-3 bacterium]|nr:hypothetical protein [candidate division WOR-3 bacterium]